MPPIEHGRVACDPLQGPRPSRERAPSPLRECPRTLPARPPGACCWEPSHPRRSGCRSEGEPQLACEGRCRARWGPYHDRDSPDTSIMHRGNRHTCARPRSTRKASLPSPPAPTLESTLGWPSPPPARASPPPPRVPIADAALFQPRPVRSHLVDELEALRRGPCGVHTGHPLRFLTQPFPTNLTRFTGTTWSPRSGSVISHSC